MSEHETKNRTMSPVDWVLLLILSILWGASFLFNGIAVRELPTLTIVLARVGLAALSLMMILPIFGIKLPTEMRVWRSFFWMALLNNVIPFSLIVWAQSSITSGLASILNATTPIFTVLAAHVLTRDEKLSVNRLIGVILGFVGVAVMLGDGSMDLESGITAKLACLAAAVSYAFAGIYGRRFFRMSINPIMVSAGTLTMSSMLLFPIVLFLEQPWKFGLPTVETIGALVGLALLSTALAYILYFRILASAGAVNLLLVTFLIPPSAIFLGLIVLDEVLVTQEILGMSILALGLMAIDGRLWPSRGTADSRVNTQQ